MGIVSSRVEDGANLFLRDQNRFAITEVIITNSRNRVILRITPEGFPATTYTARRDAGDETPVDYIQDPDLAPTALPSFLLRLCNDDELLFTFIFSLRQDVSLAAGPASEAPTAIDTNINGLTFMAASAVKDLEYLGTKELQSDPNLQKNNPNVHLIGDLSTGGNLTVQSQWTWRWRAPRAIEDKSGWRTVCSFVEYDQRVHQLVPLATFTFWVHAATRASIGIKSPSPRLDVAAPRIRLPSSQSLESRVSDSEGEMPSASKDAQPPSPGFEAIPEDGLSLVPTASIASHSAIPAAKVETLHRPGEDVSTVEDGPLFRATMKAMEQRTGSMRSRWKKVLKRAEAAVEAQRAHNHAVSDLVDALRDASRSNANAVQPALEHYFDKIAREIALNDRQNAINLERMIIDPIARLYNNDIKAVDAKKRDFDEESKDYYAFLGRYLGQRSDSMKDKKRLESDKKYEDRRRNFELQRFDYSSFMQDLHGGRKDQEVLSQLTRYAQAQAKGFLATAKKIDELLPQLDALTTEVSLNDKEYLIHRTEREERRRAIEKGVGGADFDPNGFMPSQQISQGSSSLPQRIPSTSHGPSSRSLALPGAPITRTVTNGTTQGTFGSPGAAGSMSQINQLATSPGSDRFKGYRDLEERDQSITSLAVAGQHRKEGLVWALSRPGSHADPKGLNKQAWHKFWIVLDQGKLSEYTNWKQSLDLNMDPIDLRVASVREARNADRRFCFEIITPNFTRVYQAPNEDEIKAWIATINNAIQSSVEGKGMTSPIPTTSTGSGSIRKDIASVLTGKSASTGHRSGYVGGSSNRIPSRHSTVADRPSHHAVELTESSERLVRQLRDADAGNQYCADCGSDQKVDWVSINLGVIICIECSGIHRSLGTHISKIRSLTLDPNAFTIDVVELLLLIGNRVANMIWEARLVDRAQKPTALSNREHRLRFITAKYSERIYVQNLSPTLSPFGTPDETLLASIKKNDIQNVVYALALRANPNSHDKSRNTHAVYLALAAADPAAPSATASPVLSPRGAPPPPDSSASSTFTTSTAPVTARKAFALAELLLLNGADMPMTPAPIPLSASARLYLDSKAEQKLGRRPLPGNDGMGIGTGGDGMTALPEFRGSNGLSAAHRGVSQERAPGELDRLRKRVSASGRLVKAGGMPGGGMGMGMGGPSAGAG